MSLFTTWQFSGPVALHDLSTKIAIGLTEINYMNDFNILTLISRVKIRAFHRRLRQAALRAAGVPPLPFRPSGQPSRAAGGPKMWPWT